MDCLIWDDSDMLATINFPDASFGCSEIQKKKFNSVKQNSKKISVNFSIWEISPKWGLMVISQWLKNYGITPLENNLPSVICNFLHIT